MYELKPFDSLHLGQTVSVRKTITEADGALYIAATGDFGPVHVDDSYAQTTRFGQRLAPGILVAGICTSVLTAELAAHWASRSKTVSGSPGRCSTATPSNSRCGSRRWTPTRAA